MCLFFQVLFYYAKEKGKKKKRKGKKKKRKGKKKKRKGKKEQKIIIL
jgi:hypothetical protein